ncbi:hypothetical protein ABB30_11525 [Stenotrophomonas ginsengisoli]|uniref:Uncharacterized protein n=1 Tax=Stenotrophomonas ginsengisoli TaxID=336566 RepID=A0A0R0DAK2_9GAMM|nr:hypothetical protein ABB30_11525 [Stenotrophomonas ginsengisoli]
MIVVNICNGIFKVPMAAAWYFRIKVQYRAVTVAVTLQGHVNTMDGRVRRVRAVMVQAGRQPGVDRPVGGDPAQAKMRRHRAVGNHLARAGLEQITGLLGCLCWCGMAAGHQGQ